MTSELRLRIETGLVRAETVRKDAVTWAGETAFDGPGDLAEAIAQLAAEPKIARGQMRVELASPLAQLRTLHDLPPVRDADLAALVRQQSGRFFRRNGHALVTDAVWVRNGHHGARVVLAAAAEEHLIAAIAAGAREAGLRLETIHPAEATAPLNLIPDAERVARRRADLLAVRRLAAIAAALWLVAGAMYSGRMIVARHRVEREFAAVQAPLDALLIARRDLRDAEAMVAAVRRSTTERHLISWRLGAITMALPDSAFLSSLTLDLRGRGLMAGAARKAGDVLEALAKNRAVEHPRFEGQITREVMGRRELDRFTISFDAAVKP